MNIYFKLGQDTVYSTNKPQIMPSTGDFVHLPAGSEPAARSLVEYRVMSRELTFDSDGLRCATAYLERT
jgi:hypothetical protein